MKYKCTSFIYYIHVYQSILTHNTQLQDNLQMFASDVQFLIRNLMVSLLHEYIQLIKVSPLKSKARTSTVEPPVI